MKKSAALYGILAKIDEQMPRCPNMNYTTGVKMRIVLYPHNDDACIEANTISFIPLQTEQHLYCSQSLGELMQVIHHLYCPLLHPEAR